MFRVIKLFACDLDGTLLNYFHSTDRKILGAIRAVTDAGAHVAIATGRTFTSPNDHGFAGAPVELLGSNGSIVRDRTGKVLKTFPMDKGDLEQLLRTFPEVCFECVAPDGTFVNRSRAERAQGFNKSITFARIVMRGMQGTKQMLDAMTFDQSVEQILSHEVCKINCRVLDPVLRDELKAYLAETPNLVDAPFNPSMFEITQRGVDKGAGVAWLAQHLGYTEDEVAVYGDGGNDIAMLERFEHAYAPSNASDAAKRAAGHVIGSNVFHAVPLHMVATVDRERSRTVIA